MFEAGSLVRLVTGAEHTFLQLQNDTFDYYWSVNTWSSQNPPRHPSTSNREGCQPRIRGIREGSRPVLRRLPETP